MALPSQTERQSDLPRSYVYQRGGLRTKLPIIGVGVLIAAAALGGIWWLSKSLKPANAGNDQLADSSKANQPAPGDTKGSKPSGTNKPGNTNSPARPTNSLTNNPPNTAPSTPPASNPTSSPGASTPGSSTPGAGTPAGPETKPSTTDTGKPLGTDLTRPDGKPLPTNPNGTNPAGPGTPLVGPDGKPLPAPGPNSPLPPTGSTNDVRQMLAEGDRKRSSGDLIGARAAYSKALLNNKAASSDQNDARSKLDSINEQLIFSTRITAGDPMFEEYTVASGDNYTKIVKAKSLLVDPNLLFRINKTESTKLRIGQKLKLIRGPFHAVVDKSDYRLDLFWGPPKNENAWIYVKSFKVGLGANDYTPVGTFTVKSGGRAVDPNWTDPKTGQKFAPYSKDPKNPVGTRWIAIQGEGDAAKYKGFGIHGTIEPESIGQQKSMGCVRMLKDDVELVFDFLTDQISVVKIQP